VDIGTDHFISHITIGLRHLDSIFIYSLLWRRDQRRSTGEVGTPSDSKKIAVQEFSKLSGVSFEGQPLFALCFDELNQ